MIKRIIAGCCAFLLITLVIMAGPTDLGYFIDPPSFWIVIIMTWLLMSCGYGFSEFLNLFSTYSKKDIGQKQSSYYKSMARNGAVLSVVVGFIGSLLGSIQILYNLREEVEYFEFGFATALLAFLYGILLAVFVFVPLYLNLSRITKTEQTEAKKVEYEETSEAEKSSLRKVVKITIITIVTLPFLIYSLAMITHNPDDLISGPDQYYESLLSHFEVTIGGKKLLFDLTIHSTELEAHFLFSEDQYDGVKSLAKVFRAEVIEYFYKEYPEGFSFDIKEKKKAQTNIKLILNNIANELAPEMPGQILRVYFSRLHYE